MQRTTRLSAVALVVSLVSIPLLAVTAHAHVTVQPPEAEQGGFAKIALRVPNERPTASTVELRVQLPPDHPFTSVSVKPKQGWTAEVTKRTLAEPITSGENTVTEVASEITWTGGQIQPGQFDEFEISVGRLPTDVDELFFPTIQVYDNGETVSWIELPAADGEEAENPAPELTLVAASGDEHGGSASAAAAATTDDHDGDSSNGLAIAALIVGGVAIVLSIVAIASGRRKTAA